MREYFMYGSVRGAAGNGGPYRDLGTVPQMPTATSRHWSYRAPAIAFGDLRRVKTY